LSTTKVKWKCKDTQVLESHVGFVHFTSKSSFKQLQRAKKSAKKFMVVGTKI